MRNNLFLMFCCFCGLSLSISSAVADEERWQRALETTYVHGIDESIAREEIGTEGINYLNQQLLNDGHPRRDNIVAFLGWLGDDTSVNALTEFLENPPITLERVEEDRAALLVPLALGDIARRGEKGARLAKQELLKMTAHDRDGSELLKKASARRSSRPEKYRDDLLEQAIFGLARSGKLAGAKRLRSVAFGAVIPARGGRDLRKSAQAGLTRYKKLFSATARKKQTQVNPETGVASKTSDAFSEPSPLIGELVDNSDTFHSLGLTFSNHVDHPDPMTDSRLDQVLASVSQRMQTEDFETDTACCLAMSRSGTAKTFGVPGDGLDILDSDTETRAAMDNTSAHVKVVRAINACGGTISTNIIGCGWIGRKGIVLERRSDVGQEGALWAHENGHNAGLGHNSEGIDFIMYGSLGYNNRALLGSECSTFHATSTGGVKTAHGQCCEGQQCEPGCGNGFLEAGEECDGTDTGGASCISAGFDGGTLTCNSNCTINTANCTTCGNGVLESGEECEAGNTGSASCGDAGCLSGTPSCSSSCTIDYGSCSSCPACNSDGICDIDENCGDCSDCLQQSGEPQCGNGACEIHAGENCQNCPSDCAGRQNGKPNGRFCCGNGGENPVGCGDSRCSEGSNICISSNLPGSCCNDGACTGVENSFNCEIDCGPPPSCRIAGEACISNDECCSSNCGGKKNSKTCR